MILEFNNMFHLGDCIYSIIYFNKILRLDNVDKVIFYCNPTHFGQLQEIIEGDIELFTYQDKGQSTWLNREGLYHGPGNFNGKYGRIKNSDEIYMDLFNYLSRLNNLDISFDSPIDCFYDSPEFLENIDDYDNDYDLLIINSAPLSGQFPHTEQQFKSIADKLSDKYKIITTKKIDGYDYTLDKRYTCMDIAKLSHHIDRVITIHTAPHILTLNKWNVQKFKTWTVLDLHHSYSFDFVKHYTNLNELENNLDLV